MLDISRDIQSLSNFKRNTSNAITQMKQTGKSLKGLYPGNPTKARNAGDRELLFDLDTVRRSIFAKEGKTVEFDLISKTIANLLRKWAEL